MKEVPKQRADNYCRSYARQSVDCPPSGDGSYIGSDSCFPHVAKDPKTQVPNWFVLRPSLGVWVFGCLGVFLAGCGTSYDATISGKVTIDGAPLTKGTVSFHPVGGGPVATGTIQSDGSFDVQTATTEGLPPGEYKVTVVATDPPPPSTTGEELPGILLTAPEFGRLDSTPLTFTVKAGANNFEIPVNAAPAS